MEISKAIARIITEKKKGDIERACSNIGVKKGVWMTAKQKETFEDLSVDEERLIGELTDTLDKRKALKAKIQGSC